MKRKHLSLLASLLTVLFVLPIMVSCGGDETSSTSNTSAVSQIVSEESTSSRKDVKDNLPVKDFGGRDFVIFCRTEHKYEFAESETATDFINDVIQKRNDIVEDRFGVNIKTFDVIGNWGPHTDFFTTLRSHLQSGEDEYQLVAGYAAIIPAMISEGIFQNWKDIDYIDLDQPWWSSDLNDELTINNKLFLLTGDISITLWENMCAMFYNKTLAKDATLPDLYELVRDGEWTYDKMTEYARLATKDDGNGVVGKEDTFGYISAKTTQVDIYQDAFDLSVTQKNSQGVPEFTMNNQKTSQAVTMLYDFLCQSDYTYTDFTTTVETTADQEQYTMFGEGRALFIPARLQWGEYINQYQIEYGILPMPKFDVEQTSYYSSSIDNFSMVAVPYTVQDTEFVGIITEALCAESYRNVVEDYYQTILRSRYVNDQGSAEMIDIIRDGLKFNFGYIYSYTLGWPAHQINICINNNNADFTSLWQASEDIFKNNLEDHLKIYLD
ncbi:MAG: hypothetical protein PHY15_08825 [Eubacteriales bacterium]|nr:hypothetical protein [Eubacteriales bacterium]MDD4475378.1 hypothetical protein [Eubacteriales bacterium]